MCELLGMDFNLPVNPRVSFIGFQQRGEENSDGWGLAWYPDESAQVIKEQLTVGKSQISRFLVNYSELQSSIFIGHVRKASISGLAYKNTHPFIRELNGKDYVFAHNGTLRNYKRLELGRFKPIGTTDSEHCFCYLLEKIAERNVTTWTKTDFMWLADSLSAINTAGKGTLNCIFSEGTHLFCYFDKIGYKGLYFVKRQQPFDTIQLLDEDWNINLGSQKPPDQKGIIVATKPLTDEEWEPFIPGELLVIKNGEIIYSSKRENSQRQVIIEKRSFVSFKVKKTKIENSDSTRHLNE
ncbi:MAG: class II glutamine amidotransferase [Promethearchaeota archaeon]